MAANAAGYEGGNAGFPAFSDLARRLIAATTQEGDGRVQ